MDSFTLVGTAVGVSTGAGVTVAGDGAGMVAQASTIVTPRRVRAATRSLVEEKQRAMGARNGVPEAKTATSKQSRLKGKKQAEEKARNSSYLAAL
jgi:hypothetical protein